MKGDDDTRGRHFWVHCWCGLIVGGLLGARISWGLFDSRWAFLGGTLAIALGFALAVAYWGDPLWHWILRHWH